MAFPENIPSVDDMLNMPVTELALMPPAMLAAVQAEIDAAHERMKAVVQRFELALEVRYAARASECRRKDGKDTGKIRFDDKGVSVISELPKRIDWDQAKLAQIAANIASAGEDPAAAERLSDALYSYYSPIAAWEEELVKEAVSLMIRLKRVPTLEVGLFKWMRQQQIHNRKNEPTGLRYDDPWSP